jgi:4'-phosphopantetheinyl transferase
MEIKVYAIHKTYGLSNLDFKKAASLLSKEKKQRIEKFKNIEDAESSLLGELLNRYMIQIEYNVPFKEIYFKYNPYGKPYWPERTDCFFNISHSGDWVVGVIGNKALGIDIEKIKPIDINVAKHVFSDIELAGLMRLSELDAINYFYEIWTYKESYIKALGKGFSHNPKSFTILQKGTRIYVNDESIRSTFSFKKYNIAIGYKLAICKEDEKRIFPEKPHFLTNIELVKSFI